MKNNPIQHLLTRTLLAIVTAAVTLLVTAPAHASTDWIHGGNWTTLNGIPVNVSYWAEISSNTTLAQATNVADTIANDYVSVGINFVRVAITPATITSNWPVTQVCINELIAKGLNVDLCCFYIDWTGNGLIHDINAWKSMWQIVDGVYKNNNAVYYEPINEPFGYSSESSLASTLYVPFLNSYGIQKGQNHIILDGTGYSADVTGLGADSRFNSCLLSLHIYPGWGGSVSEANYESYLQSHVGSYYGRTVITEVDAPTITGKDYIHANNSNADISCTRGVVVQCKSWGMGFTYFLATINHAGNGTVNNKLLFSGIGQALTNETMMLELQSA